jgi:hypothetical protein
MVSITPGRLYPRERLGTHCTGGWVGLEAGLDRCGKCRPTGIFFCHTLLYLHIIHSLHPTKNIHDTQNCLGVQCHCQGKLSWGAERFLYVQENHQARGLQSIYLLRFRGCHMHMFRSLRIPQSSLVTLPLLQ